MRVLIVEDERRLAEALGQIMAEQRYQADVVYDGADGLDYGLTGQYDVIILKEGETIPRFEIGAPPLDQMAARDDRNASMVPVFSVTVEDGQVTAIRDDELVNVSGETALQAAQEALATGQQDRLRLTVHNTGDPIPPEHLPHLFERFYRADPSRDRSQGGYGLGLAIARSIAETHRGKISVTSAAGGTAFTVLLPGR